MTLRESTRVNEIRDLRDGIICKLDDKILQLYKNRYPLGNVLTHELEITIYAVNRIIRVMINIDAKIVLLESACKS